MATEIIDTRELVIFEKSPSCVIEKDGKVRYDQITKKCGVVEEGYRLNDGKQEVLEKIRIGDAPIEDYDRKYYDACCNSTYSSDNIIGIESYSIQKLIGCGHILYRSEADSSWIAYRNDQYEENEESLNIFVLLRGDEHENKLVTINRGREYFPIGDLKDYRLLALETPCEVLSFETPFKYIITENNKEIKKIYSKVNHSHGISTESESDVKYVELMTLDDEYFFVVGTLNSMEQTMIKYYKISEDTYKKIQDKLDNFLNVIRSTKERVWTIVSYATSTEAQSIYNFTLSLERTADNKKIFEDDFDFYSDFHWTS